MRNNELIKKRFKPNVVYELLIHGVYHYAGCHCTIKDYLNPSVIIHNSGNYLVRARDEQLITPQEYRDCVELINVWEFNTKQEAQEFEAKKIQELKDQYGDLCKNKAPFGNINGCKGCDFYSSKEWREKMSLANKNKIIPEETRRKVKETKNKPEFKKKCSERMLGNTYSKGRYWFTNGSKCVMAYECPEGFWAGRILKKRQKS